MNVSSRATPRSVQVASATQAADTLEGGTSRPAARIGRRVVPAGLEADLYRRSLGPVVGVDEAGRGACAGPLVIAACALGPKVPPELAGLDDSKRLRPARREELAALIKEHALAWSVVRIEVSEIDRDGVHYHNIAGMRQAVAKLGITPGYVLTDGYEIPGLAEHTAGLVRGDAACPSISAASVLAKVTRDRIMVELDRRHSGYGLAGHKGYGTAAHQSALVNLGPSPEHRLSYANVRRAAAEHARHVEEGEASP